VHVCGLDYYIVGGKVLDCFGFYEQEQLFESILRLPRRSSSAQKKQHLLREFGSIVAENSRTMRGFDAIASKNGSGTCFQACGETDRMIHYLTTIQSATYCTDSSTVSSRILIRLQACYE
jgi:hypothetical protein